MRSKLSAESSLVCRRALGCIIGSALGLVGLSWSETSAAHFTLNSPPSWVEEDSFGNPQKIAPCGGDQSQATGTVTSYRAGSLINVSGQETVGHPGHFRISLARDRADLIDPHVVTSTGDGKTGLSMGADIMDPPGYPVLLDGIFARQGIVSAQVDPFSIDVQLPAETCEKCTLQVIQFMSNHEPDYFYHHCADLHIVAADAVLPVEPPRAAGAGGSRGASGGQTSSAGSSASSPDADDGGGCALSAASSGTSASKWFALLGLGVIFWRRRAT